MSVEHGVKSGIFKKSDRSRQHFLEVYDVDVEAVLAWLFGLLLLRFHGVENV